MSETRTQGRRWVLSSFEESRNAAIQVARVAQRKISIFTQDMDPGIYDHDDFLNAAKRLVLAKSYARIEVLIADPARVVRGGNLLVTLGRRLNTYIEFRNVHEDYRDHREAFLIADETALLYRVDASRWEGIADTYEPAVARRYLRLFNEIWAASVVEQELRELHV
jgi:hypothetical protein